MHSQTQTNDSGLARTCAAGMAVTAGLIRLIPHPFNFTPIDALGLFGGARLRSRLALVLPLTVMVVSDLLLWALQLQGQRGFSLRYAFNPWVYASFFLAVLGGRLLLRNGSTARLAVVTVLVGVQFFLVTNFAAWRTLSGPHLTADGTIAPPLYARDLSGLIASYIAALPFAVNQLLGDLFYTGLLFGLYALLRSGALLPRRLRQPAAVRTP